MGRERVPMPNKLHHIPALLACTLALVGAPSLAGASDRESMIELASMVDLLEIRGYACRDIALGDELATNHAYAYDVVLGAGNDYVIVAAGDSTTRDLDLEILDENGSLIDADFEPDATPMVEADPAWTGTFTVRVTMARGHRASNFAVCFR